MSTIAINNKNRYHNLLLFLILFVFLNVCIWLYSHKQKIMWPNVPAAPSESSFLLSFLNDPSFAYRSFAMVLQNWGNVSGDVQPLKNYNFKNLESWFFLLDKMDPHSSYVPFMAAYYFGATQDKTQLVHIIKYLEEIGVRPQEGNWRWLVHAAYLAKNEMNDLKEALRLAEKLSSVYTPSMPAWTLNMKEIIRAEMGDRETAYALTLEILKSNAQYMDPAEINYMLSTICERILTPIQAKQNPICSNIK